MMRLKSSPNLCQPFRPLSNRTNKTERLSLKHAIIVDIVKSCTIIGFLDTSLFGYTPHRNSFLFNISSAGADIYRNL